MADKCYLRIRRSHSKTEMANAQASPTPNTARSIQDSSVSRKIQNWKQLPIKGMGREDSIRRSSSLSNEMPEPHPVTLFRHSRDGFQEAGGSSRSGQNPHSSAKRSRPARHQPCSIPPPKQFHEIAALAERSIDGRSNQRRLPIWCYAASALCTERIGTTNLGGRAGSAKRSEVLISATVKCMVPADALEETEQVAQVGVYDCNTLVARVAARRVLLLGAMGARPAGDDWASTTSIIVATSHLIVCKARKMQLLCILRC